ncbi:MAG: hypothetical protein U9P36_03275 [Thermodesulfobacteriota bacterium]|nr:hypothetical protein [Thermodesulfobacteriota bacterium]
MRPHLLCRYLNKHRQLSESSLTCLLRCSAHLQPPRLVKYAGYMSTGHYYNLLRSYVEN